MTKARPSLSALSSGKCEPSQKEASVVTRATSGLSLAHYCPHVILEQIPDVNISCDSILEYGPKDKDCFLIVIIL